MQPTLATVTMLRLRGQCWSGAAFRLRCLGSEELDGRSVEDLVDVYFFRLVDGEGHAEGEGVGGYSLLIYFSKTGRDDLVGDRAGKFLSPIIGKKLVD